MKDPPPPSVSIVVATHRRAELLRACLESCRRQTLPGVEILVVLNPPNEDSLHVAHELRVRYLCTHRNLGVFPSRALGIANTRGEYVMIMDDDSHFLHDDCLAKLTETLSASPQLVAVTCNVYGPQEPPPAESTGLVAVFKDGFTLYRRALFEEIAGHVPDLCFRAGGELYLASIAYEKGYGIAVRHDARMYHHQTDIGRDHRAMNRFAVRNHALLSVMQEPAVVVPLSLGRKLVSSFARIAVGRRDPGSWAAGWLGFAALAPTAWRLRRPISIATWRRLRAMRRGERTHAWPPSPAFGCPLAQSPGDPGP